MAKNILILLVSLTYVMNFAYVGAWESFNIPPMGKAFKIIFAKYSEKVGDSKKTANCLIVLATDAKNISYCKYSYLGSELCDPKDGINMADIKLGDYAKIRVNLKTWFKNNTNQELSDDKLQIIIDLISTNKQELATQSAKIIILTKQELNNFKPLEKYNSIPQKKFAWLIHKLIEKLRFIDISAVEVLQTETLYPNVSLLDDFQKKLAKNMNNAVVLFGLGIILVFLLLGSFLIHQRNKLINQLSKDTFSELRQDLKSELQQQMTNGLEEIKQLIISKQVTLYAEQDKTTNLPPSNQQQSLDISQSKLGKQWLTTQFGIWNWLQPTLTSELLACQTQIKQIEESTHNHKILELLELNNLLQQLDNLVGQIFDSDSELWHFLRNKDSGKWLNRLLRADDLLQAYFLDEEPQFRLLSQHLANISSLFQTIFLENGVEFIKPKLLETVPEYVAEKYYVYKPHPLLKELVKPQVQARFKIVSRFVVDIETYGFVTKDSPCVDIRLFVSSPAEWE